MTQIVGLTKIKHCSGSATATVAPPSIANNKPSSNNDNSLPITAPPIDNAVNILENVIALDPCIQKLEA